MRFALALALALAWLLAAGNSSATSVAFDLRGLSTEEYRRIDGLGLERKVLLRLVQEGFAVVAFDRGPDVSVRASIATDGLELAAKSAVSSLRLTVATDGPPAEWQLEVSHKVCEMARRLAPVPRDEPVRPEAEASATTPRTPPPAAAAPAVPDASKRADVSKQPDVSKQLDARFEVGLGAGAVFRAGGSEPLVGVTTTGSLGRMRFYLDVFGAPSNETDVEIWESQGSAGMGFAIVDGALGVEIGLAAGVLIHRYSLASRWASDRSGTRVLPGFWAPVRLRWAASKRVVLSARPALGWSRSPVHVSGGATLWSRGTLRLETVAVLAWAF